MAGIGLACGIESEWMGGAVEGPTVSNATAGSRVGSQFGHYLLKRLLGSGGFGEVYEAQDTEMDRVVAIKLLSAHYSQNAGFRQRLYREARTAGQLYEPHVVPIHRCGEINGQLYIDMRFIEGADLHTVLAQHRQLDPARAVAIVHQIASALDAAHAKQMVHRDVKPGNILLTGQDFAYLVDFGLANAATDAVLTSTNTTIGTFAYMAPERLGNAEVSHHTDTYALACVLYECLTGSPPYPTHDLPALITAHLTGPIPRPSQHASPILAGFDGVIARGMAKDPRDRYASAGDLATAAHNALTTPYQQHADTILAHTQVASLPAADPVATHAAYIPPRPPANVSTKLAHGSAKASPAASRRERFGMVAAAVTTVAAVLIGIGLVIGHQSRSNASDEHYGQQVVLPFTGLSSPVRVAADAAGNVYVTGAASNRVLELQAGSNTEVELPQTGSSTPFELAVGADGTVYATDGSGYSLSSQVEKLPVGANAWIPLPFPSVQMSRMAVDASGAVYVTDSTNNQVLKLSPGSSTAVQLPFGVFKGPGGVAADAAGNVYLADRGNSSAAENRLLKLPAGSNAPVRLPFNELEITFCLAVDKAGNLYLGGAVDVLHHKQGRVFKLPAGSNNPIELPFTGLGPVKGLAVDTAGNVYITDEGRVRNPV